MCAGGDLGGDMGVDMGDMLGALDAVQGVEDSGPSRASAKAGDARAQYLEWVAELMASADEGEKDEWYNRLHYTAP